MLIPSAPFRSKLERQEAARRGEEARRLAVAEEERARLNDGDEPRSMQFTEILVEYLALHGTGHNYSPRGQALAAELDRRSPA